MSSLLEINRFLAFILRHKPESIGITLDEHGWANVAGQSFMYADKVTLPPGDFTFKTFNKRGCRYIEVYGEHAENITVAAESAAPNVAYSTPPTVNAFSDEEGL